MATARTLSGLWVADGFNFLRHRATERTVTASDGRRAKVTVDDSGTVTQIEYDEQLDAIVRPKTVTIKRHPEQQRADEQILHRLTGR